MLTAKQNMIECMKPGGKPDRFVNQYEAVHLVFHPGTFADHSPQKGEENVVNNWGVTNSWPASVPGPFPVHTPEKILVQDIENWKDYVHAPSLDFPQELWDLCQGMFDAVDTEKAFKAVFVAPGLFEQTHHMCEMVNALYYYVDYPDEMHDLIKYIADYELRLAEIICDRLHPDMLFHHDDWGSHDSTFLSPAMFEDFLLEPYKEIYGYYKSHGVDYVVHHSDSYAGTLVGDMVEMGIDVFQGCMETNKIDEQLKKYGEKISYMGVIENAYVDKEDWSAQECEDVARRICKQYGTKNFIPCIAQGGPGSVFPGVYQALSDAIDKINYEEFGCDIEEQQKMREPIQIMF